MTQLQSAMTHMSATIKEQSRLDGIAATAKEEKARIEKSSFEDRVLAMLEEMKVDLAQLKGGAVGGGDTGTAPSRYKQEA